MEAGGVGSSKQDLLKHSAPQGLDFVLVGFLTKVRFSLYILHSIRTTCYQPFAQQLVNVNTRPNQ